MSIEKEEELLDRSADREAVKEGASGSGESQKELIRFECDAFFSGSVTEQRWRI